MPKQRISLLQGKSSILNQTKSDLHRLQALERATIIVRTQTIYKINDRREKPQTTIPSIPTVVKTTPVNIPTVTAHLIQGAFANGFGSSPFLGGGPTQVLSSESFDRVIILALTYCSAPSNNLSWIQFNAGTVEIWYAYLPAGQAMNNIIVTNIAPMGFTANPVAVYVRPDTTRSLVGNVDASILTQTTLFYMDGFSTVPEEVNETRELVVSGFVDGTPTITVEYDIPSSP